MLTILSWVSPYWKEDVKDKWLQYVLPVSVTDPTARIIFIFSKSKVKRWVEFAVGMSGTIVFLLEIVIISCTVSEYGLRGATWIAYGAAVVLYGLRVKIESVALVNREGEETQVVIK